MTEIESLQALLKTFRDAQGWGKHHTPKNLAASVAIEAAELMECYQWTDDYGNGDITKGNNVEEAADVFIYLLNFCEVTGIDLVAATLDKIEKNGRKYPPTRKMPCTAS